MLLSLGRNYDLATRLRRGAMLLTVAWLALVGCSAVWNAFQIRSDARQLARAQARAVFEDDVSYRRWMAKQGGIYVRVTQTTPPNPSLASVPERDITTPLGQQLTLVNSAYLTRLLAEFGRGSNASIAVKSLTPVLAENMADPWESNAIVRLEQGAKEVSSIQRTRAGSVMRLAGPLYKEPNCSKCHGGQSRQDGQLMGLVSVTVPMERFEARAFASMLTVLLAHVVLGGAGVAGIGWGRRRLEQAAIGQANVEEYFRSLYNHAPIAYQSLGENGELLMVNDAWLQMLGYTRSEVNGRTISDFMTSESRALFPERFEEFKRSGTVTGAEFDFVHKGGSVFRVSTDGRIAWDADGKFCRTHCVLTNITQRSLADRALRQSEAHYRLLAENASDVIWVADVETGKLTYVSPSVERMRGYRPEEIMGTSLVSAVTSDTKHLLKVVNERAAQFQAGKDISYTDEVEQPRKDGTTLWAEVVSQFRFNPDTGRLEMFGATRDIDQRKRAEAELEQQERQLSTLADNLPAVVQRFGANSRLQYANREFERITGLVLSSCLGKLASELTGSAHELAPSETVLKRVLQTGKPERLEFKTNCHGAAKFWEAQVVPERYQSGAIQSALVIAFDVSSRVEAERLLRDNQEKYEAVFTNDVFAICLFDTATLRMVEVNRAFARLYGYSKAELESGMTLTAISAEPDSTHKSVQHALEAGSVYVPLGNHVKKDGTAFPVELSAGLFEWKGRHMGVLLTNDITDKKRNEDCLRNSRADLERAQAVAHIGSWSCGLSLARPLEWSAETRRIFGYVNEDFDNRLETFWRHVHPEDLEMVSEMSKSARRGERRYEIEHRIVRVDGTVRWVREQAEIERDASGNAVRMVGTIQDITDRRQIEEQLRQSQKMKAVGQLAGGVAHDFNNILAAMLMQISLLQRNPAVPPVVQSALRDLEQGANRAANLTRQLLLFSRQSVMQPRVLDLNELIENLLKMLRRLLGEHITLDWRGKSDLPPVNVDPGMIDQVVMNLCVNARDAMPRGGVLTISTDKIQLDSNTGTEERRAGTFVSLMISDNGCGMDEGTIKRIFEPFFTTKDVGKGTGLGLATVHGIVKQHQGWVEVASAPGQGSNFHVFLPASSSPRQLEPSLAGGTVAGGKETILLVEDEMSLRSVVAHSLRRCGYEVLEASTGREAVSHWRKSSCNVGLLFTDMVMPEGMTGLELAEQLRAQKPELPVVISSGYTASLGAEGSLARARITFFPKPYDLSALARVVRTCLDNADPKVC